MTTCTSVPLPRRRVQGRVDVGLASLGLDGEVQHVTAWATVREVGNVAAPMRLIATTRDPIGSSSSEISVPRPAVVERALERGTPWRVGSVHSAGRGLGISRRITWSVVHATVATVVMPSRW